MVNVSSVCVFSDAASPRGRAQGSGASGEEEGEPASPGGTEDADAAAGGGETPQRGRAPPTGPLRQVTSVSPVSHLLLR